jgi:hypothetical protein
VSLSFDENGILRVFRSWISFAAPDQELDDQDPDNTHNKNQQKQNNLIISTIT